MKEEDQKKEAISFKHNLYEHINVPLKTMDWMIGVIAVAIILFVTFGIWQAHIG